MTIPLEKETEHVVAVVSVDSPFGYTSNVDTTYHGYKTRSLAEMYAGKFLLKMQTEGPTTAIRGVFIKEGQNWKTVGSYFDV